MRFFFLAWLLFWAAGCTPQAPLRGRLEPEPDAPRPVVWLVQPQQWTEIAASFAGKIIDSAGLQPDGTFQFVRMPATPEPALFELVVQPPGTRFPNRLEDDSVHRANYLPFVWADGEHVECVAQAGRFQASARLHPLSADNAALLRLRDLRQSAFRSWQAAQPADPHDPATLPRQEVALPAFRQPLMAFADSCKVFLPALVAVRWVSPTGDFERNPEFLARQCARWQQRLPAHLWATGLCAASAGRHLPLLQGEEVPDFPMPLRTGDTVGLHRLLGQRLTLLDLWASWCAPCRRENRDVLVPLWNAFRNRGFQVVGYALEADAAAWQKAIEKDGVGGWPHASHLRGDEAPLLEALRLRTIPANLLLDARGRIVARNLHGEALRDFVEQYLR